MSVLRLVWILSLVWLSLGQSVASTADDVATFASLGAHFPSTSGEISSVQYTSSAGNINTTFPLERTTTSVAETSSNVVAESASSLTSSYFREPLVSSSAPAAIFTSAAAISQVGRPPSATSPVGPEETTPVLAPTRLSGQPGVTTSSIADELKATPSSETGPMVMPSNHILSLLPPSLVLGSTPSWKSSTEVVLRLPKSSAWAGAGTSHLGPVAGRSVSMMGAAPLTTAEPSSDGGSPWMVATYALAAATFVLVVCIVVLAIVLCVAIYVLKSRNLTYTVRNVPETKENSNRFWIAPTERETSPKRAKSESPLQGDTAILPVATPIIDPSDSSPSVQTFRLGRAYKQTADRLKVTNPSAAAKSASTPTVQETPAVTMTTMETGKHAESSKDEPEAPLRTIVIPTIPKQEDTVVKEKKRRPPPLKPVNMHQAEPLPSAVEGNTPQQAGGHRPTTPGSYSLQKSQAQKNELIKEFSALIKTQQDT